MILEDVYFNSVQTHTNVKHTPKTKTKKVSHCRDTFTRKLFIHETTELLANIDNNYKCI